MRAAIRDADAAIREYVTENFDALIGVLHEEADRAAADVDIAAGRLAEAIAERGRVMQAVIHPSSVIERLSTRRRRPRAVRAFRR